jgi:probable F420-dependent oxidoreductase
MKIRFAVAPGPGAFEPAAMGRFVRRSEELGFDTIWLSDVPLGAMGDPLVTLAWAAAATTTLKLGANVVPLGHNPMRLARELAQVDQLSGGRLLLAFVPGIDQPGERAALGMATGDRGARLETAMGLVRRWWAGEAVTHADGAFSFDAVTVHPRPAQDPLEIWTGGNGPVALARTGRCADGWLGATVSPEEAGAARETIHAAAADAGRSIDPEHFGISIAVARKEPSAATLAALRGRRPGVDPAVVLPVGDAAIVELLRRHIDHGMSKFVLRPSDQGTAGDDALAWLADLVLPLQT